MASRHFLTVQLAEPSISPSSPGHAAVIVGTPNGHTYAGLGPANYDWNSLGGLWSASKFEPQTVSPGQFPANHTDPHNHNALFGRPSFTSRTIPLSEEQAARALQEIDRIRSEGNNYNVFNKNVCTAIVNRIMQAAGIGSDVLYTVPSRSEQYLSEIEKSLPKPKFLIDGAGHPIPVPKALRDMQSDYAFVGGGYDTPSEGLGRFPTGAIAPPVGEVTPKSDGAVTTERVPGRFLRNRPADSPAPTVFESGTSAVPYIPQVPLASSASQPMWPQLGDGDTSPADFSDWYSRWVKPLRQP